MTRLNPVSIQIRKATQDHFGPISILHAETFAGIGVTAADSTKFLGAPEYYTWVALSEQEAVVGYAVITRRQPGIYFCWLGVNPPVRRTGIARALVGAVHDWAVEVGEFEIKLDTRNRYRSAISAYLGLGYDVVGTWTHADGDLMIQMRRNLP